MDKITELNKQLQREKKLNNNNRKIIDYYITKQTQLLDEIDKLKQKNEELMKQLNEIQDNCPAFKDCSYTQYYKDQLEEFKKKVKNFIVNPYNFDKNSVWIANYLMHYLFNEPRNSYPVENKMEKYLQALKEIGEYTTKQFCDNCEDIGSTEYSFHCEYCEYYEILQKVKEVTE